MSSLVNWLYIDLNSYFASVEQHLNPKYRGKPLAVVPMITDSTCVLAASYEAKKFGIKTGTSVGDAKKMCPGIILVSGGHEHYVRYHEKIVSVVESCHPITAVTSIDEMACALGGRDRNLENALALAQEIKNKIYKEVGVSFGCSIGLAPNRFLAKVATDMQKPNGLVTILPEDLPHKLYCLALRDLIGIGPSMERRLNQHSVYTVEKLYSLSVHEMRNIWGGVGGERFYKWIRGENLELSFNESQSISHQHVLPPKYRSTNGAYAIGQKLLSKAAQRLRKIESYTRHLSVSVRYIDRSKWWGELRMLECQDNFTLQEAFDQIWSKVKKGAPIKITICLTHFVHESERTFSFFENPKRVKLSRTMDSLNARFGKNTVYLGSVHSVLDSAPTRIAFSSIPDFEI
jgi:DNA polymerase IV